jgi:hypothetical protein
LGEDASEAKVLKITDKFARRMRKRQGISPEKPLQVSRSYYVALPEKIQSILTSKKGI